MIPSHYKYLDDNGRLEHHYRQKRSNAKRKHIPFSLTLDDYCELVERAGIKSSNLGRQPSGTGGYDLARWYDVGGYSFDNCRFITHAANLKERRMTKRGLSRSVANFEKGRAEWSSKTREERSRIMLDRTAEHRQQRKAHAEKAELLRKQRLNPAYSGENNSQYGTFWITNGVVTKKWSGSHSSIPQGYRKGRTLKPFPPSS